MDTDIELLMNKFRKDPARFIEVMFGQYPCRRDAAICHALTRGQVVSIPNIKETIELSVRLAFYFLYSFSNAKVLVVSPTKVDTLRWFEEFKEVYWTSSYDFGGRLQESCFTVSSECFVLGLHPTVDQIEQLAGFTSPNILIIFTDSDLITREVQAAALGNLNCENGKLLSLGRFDPRWLNEKG